MSAGAPAIPAPGPFPGSHAPPIGQLRVARRPNRPPSSDPLRAFQPQGHTPTTPLKPLSTPFPSAAASARSTAPPPTSIQCGRSVDDMARHPPHRCRIARNPTPVHSALGERLTYRLLQVQRSLSKESQTSAVTWPPQPDNSASRDDQPRPRSLTTTSHPRVSGVLRYAGDLQHRSGQPAHQYRVHGAAAGSGRALFDGRSRSLSGQCVHQAVFIKRLWRSLKYEAVYLRQLADGFMAQRVIDEWSSSPTRCDRARHWMVGRRRPSTAGSRRPDRRWRSGHGAQVAIAGSEGRGPAGAQSGKGGYPQCPQDQAPLPRTSTPFYRHLFLTARGALTITRIYLNLPPGGEPNLPLPTSIEMTPDASAVVTFHRNHWKGSPEYAPCRVRCQQARVAPEHDVDDGARMPPPTPTCHRRPSPQSRVHLFVAENSGRLDRVQKVAGGFAFVHQQPVLVAETRSGCCRSQPNAIRLDIDLQPRPRREMETLAYRLRQHDTPRCIHLEELPHTIDNVRWHP